MRTVSEIKPGTVKTFVEWLTWFNTPKKTRCWGRCDGVNDLCYTDMICPAHDVEGCRVCWPDPE